MVAANRIFRFLGMRAANCKLSAATTNFQGGSVLSVQTTTEPSRLQAASAQCCERYEGQPIRLPFFIAFSVS
jgi:hypothetical protein